MMTTKNLSPKEPVEREGAGTHTRRIALPPSLETGRVPLVSPLTENPESMVLGPYHIFRKIGHGASGVVYEAWDSREHRKVAVKIMHKGPQASEDDVRRFHQEAESSMKLRHPHIVRIHEKGRENQLHYICMDFVEGLPLDAWAFRDRKNHSSNIKLVEKVARAVEYAHQQGVIHRDLKPGNIMVDVRGDPQIMDFGLAWDISVGSVLTQAGEILGTPAYMSPEQAEARMGNVGPSTDVWSLGVILFEVLTGRRPFDGRNVYEILYSLLHGEPPSMVGLAHRIPVDLQRITLKCLEKQPEQRYGTAAGLAEDLQAWREGRKISIRTPLLWTRLKRGIRRRRGVSFGAFSDERAARQRAELKRREMEEKIRRELSCHWETVFEDDFSDPDVKARWSLMGGRWELKDGCFRIRNGHPQILYLKMPVSGNVRVEFVCHQQGSFLQDMSCFLAAIPSSNFWKACESGYMFQFGVNMNTRSKMMRENITLKWSAGEKILPGKIYHIRAERVGGNLALEVNGKKILEAVDEDPLDGTDRCLVGLYGWKADTWIHRVQVDVLVSPMKEDLLEVAERLLARNHFKTAMDLFREVEMLSGDETRKKLAAKGVRRVREIMELNEKVPSYQEKLASIWPGVGLTVRKDTLSININHCEVTDLEPLRGMPINSLYCRDNQIKSLDPLEGMELQVFHGGCNPLADLSPLRWAPLNELVLDQNQLVSLEPLRGMNFSLLKLDRNQISSLEPLGKSIMEMLNVNHNPLRSLRSLRQAELRILQAVNCSLENLDGLQEKSIHELFVSDNDIQQLEPLEGLPLEHLQCWGNPLKTLHPFITSPPVGFMFDDEGIPARELEMMREAVASSSHPSHRNYFKARTFLALRKRDQKELRKIAEEIGGGVYLTVPKRLSWAQADAFCLEHGGRLAVFECEEDLMNIQHSRQMDVVRVWLGFKLNHGKLEGSPTVAAQSLVEGFKITRNQSGPISLGVRGIRVEKNADILMPFIMEFPRN